VKNELSDISHMLLVPHVDKACLELRQRLILICYTKQSIRIVHFIIQLMHNVKYVE